LLKSGDEKRRLMDTIAREPEAFRTKLKGDIAKMVERWRTDLKIDIPPEWKVKREAPSAGAQKENTA
jgi:hypothetical protein